ncbi:hypothetical protein BGZ79_007402 [Entomortierella chlamydospora]|nr:hypothetical protein BGZ79_007402 [Entomortierella chlamydospora]
MANIPNNITSNESNSNMHGDITVSVRNTNILGGITTYENDTNTDVPGDITTNADMPGDVTGETNDLYMELPSFAGAITPEDIINEQIQVIDSIGRGDDYILIAGCGWGKSLVYSLPREIWYDRIILVISPLKSSIYDQQAKLRNMRISSVALVDDNH